MELDEIPEELKALNGLELCLICRIILFMKLIKLPMGKQKGIKGAAVNVPADLGPACDLLPQIPDDAHIISLKLKRKLEYKQTYLHDTVRPEKVITALHYLKRSNPLYADIQINERWMHSWKDDDQELYDKIFQTDCQISPSVSKKTEKNNLKCTSKRQKQLKLPSVASKGESYPQQ